MAGWLYGLGQGLQGAGQALAQYPQLKMQAAQLALQQQAAARAEAAQRRLEEQGRFEDTFKLLGQAPEGLALSPEVAAQLDPTLIKAFTKPETKPEFLPSRPLGDAAAMPVQSFVKQFRAEFEAHITEGRCPMAHTRMTVAV